MPHAPRDYLATAEVHGRFNAQGMLIAHLWAVQLAARNYTMEQAKELGHDLARQMEALTFYGGDLSPEIKYAISQHCVDHLEQIWERVETFLAHTIEGRPD